MNIKDKLEKAKKWAKIEAPNGYKFNAATFLYGWEHGSEYPQFRKVLDEDDAKYHIRKVYYMKHFDGSSSVSVEEYYWRKDGSSCQIVQSNGAYSDKVLERFPKGTRFNVQMIFKYCV